MKIVCVLARGKELPFRAIFGLLRPADRQSFSVHWRRGGELFLACLPTPLLVFLIGVVQSNDCLAYLPTSVLVLVIGVE